MAKKAEPAAGTVRDILLRLVDRPIFADQKAKDAALDEATRDLQSLMGEDYLDLLEIAKGSNASLQKMLDINGGLVTRARGFVDKLKEVHKDAWDRGYQQGLEDGKERELQP